MMSLLGSLQLDRELSIAAQSGLGAKSSEIEKNVAELLKDWPDIPPGLQDYAPPFLGADYYWTGRNFAFWFGVEFYYHGFALQPWNTAKVLCSAELDAQKGFDTRGGRRAQITCGNIGSSIPAASTKHKVVSTLGSASLRPGNYGLYLNVSPASYAFLGGLFYIAYAAGLSIDGKNVWREVFALDRPGLEEKKILHKITIAEGQS